MLSIDFTKNIVLWFQVTLDINEVRNEDYGKYVCQASNAHGHDSLRITLEKPTIYSSGASIAVSSLLMILIFANIL